MVRLSFGLAVMGKFLVFQLFSLSQLLGKGSLGSKRMLG